MILIRIFDLFCCLPWVLTRREFLKFGLELGFFELWVFQFDINLGMMTINSMT